MEQPTANIPDPGSQKTMLMCKRHFLISSVIEINIASTYFYDTRDFNFLKKMWNFYLKQFPSLKSWRWVKMCILLINRHLSLSNSWFWSKILEKNEKSWFWWLFLTLLGQSMTWSGDVVGDIPCRGYTWPKHANNICKCEEHTFYYLAVWNRYLIHLGNLKIWDLEVYWEKIKKSSTYRVLTTGSKNILRHCQGRMQLDYNIWKMFTKISVKGIQMFCSYHDQNLWMWHRVEGRDGSRQKMTKGDMRREGVKNMNF